MKQTRKQFLQKGSLAFFSILTSYELMASTEKDKGIVVLQPDQGETYWIGPRNSPLTLKIAKDSQGNDSMSFCSEEIASGEGIPIHKHLRADELIFIHTGEGLLITDEKEVPVKPGTVALIPKGLWHAVKNTGKTPMLMVFSYSPAGFEGYFREFGTPVGTPWSPKTDAEYKKMNKKWGIVYK